MVSACVCPACVFACVCVSTLVWHLHVRCQVSLITEANLLQQTNGRRKQLIESCFFTTQLLFLPCRDRATSIDGASNASYNSEHSHLPCKSTRWLSARGAPFISSEPGFASIRAAVIFLARSFGNLSSMSWLTRGLLFHPQHQPTPLSSLSWSINYNEMSCIFNSEASYENIHKYIKGGNKITLWKVLCINVNCITSKGEWNLFETFTVFKFFPRM